jgi:hypothetical protein
MAPIIVSTTLLWGILTVIFGIIVLIFPKIVNYLIALYLIISGLLMIFQAMGVA